MALYSSEKPLKSLLPLTEEQASSPSDFGAVDYIRLRIMPVLGTSPAIFGQAMASYALCQLTSCPYLPQAMEPMSKNLQHKMLSGLMKNELLRFQDKSSVDLDEDDLEFVVHQMWRGRCAVTDRRIGGNTALVLTRWRENQPPNALNLVLLAPHLAAELCHKSTEECFGREVCQRIEARIDWAKQYYI